MSHSPVELLNLRPEPVLPPLYRDGRQWLGSLIGPFLCLGTGLLIGLAAPRHQNDWLGGAILLPALIGLAVAILVSLSCAIASFKHRERYALWSLLTALPSLTVVLWLLLSAGYSVIDGFNRRQLAEIQKTYWSQLKQDPEIVLREKWYLTHDSREGMMRYSFARVEIQYTEDQLQRIYEVAPKMRDDLFQSSGCSREFLAAHFQEAYDRAEKINHSMLRHIVSHPNAPLELVEKVAQAKDRPWGAVQAARMALEKRKGEAKSGPQKG